MIITIVLTAGHICEVTTMTNRDKDMINAMAFIKQYCKDVVDGCSNCPMYDNCTNRDVLHCYPYFWYIPEV